MQERSAFGKDLRIKDRREKMRKTRKLTKRLAALFLCLALALTYVPAAAFAAKWKKQSVQTTGYQLQYSLSSKFKKAKTVTVKGPKKLYRTVKKLKGGKRYYVRVRTYKTVSGKKYVSAWSKKRAVKTKR